MKVREKEMLLKERRKYETCDCCKNPIYYENEEYEQDPCYQLDDETILCGDCLEGYIKERFFITLR